MSMEKLFGGLARIRPKTIPVGKGVLFAIALIIGKLPPKLIRRAMAEFAPVAAGKGLAYATAGAQLLAGILISYGFKTSMVRRILGETGSEAFAVAQITGAIEQAYSAATISNRDEDLSDVSTDLVVDKLFAAIGKVRGTPASAPASEETETAPVEQQAQLGAFPERGSAGWQPQGGEEEYAGPEEDPVERIEQVLAQKSEM